MKKLNYFLSLTLMSFVMLFANVAQAQSDPINLLNDIANQMIAKLKANQATIKTHPSLVYSYANQLVVPHADLDEMSKRVLPPQTWNDASSAQRQRFEKEFTTLLVRTYASALAEYKDETVKFFPVRGGYQGKSNVKVNSTIIRTDGPSISVVYSLVLRGSQWKLYDMTVEGVSMLESFRSQFADQLSQGNMEQLIQKLVQHNQGTGS